MDKQTAWEERARQAIEEAAEALLCDTYRDTQLNRQMAANADLMDTVRELRLAVATYKSALEELRRRVARFEAWGLDQ